MRLSRALKMTERVRYFTPPNHTCLINLQIKYLVHGGTVQGVNFRSVLLRVLLVWRLKIVTLSRAASAREGRRLGLVGFVRNVEGVEKVNLLSSYTWNAHEGTASKC